MRILVVTQYYWPETFIINGLVSELSRRQHSIEVLTGLPNYPSGRFNKGYGLFKGPWTELHNGVRVHRAFLFPRGKGFLRLSINYFSFIVGASLKAFFLKKNYDVILCYAPSPITACLPAILVRWLTKKPLVFWVQDLWPESLAAVSKIKSGRMMSILGRVVKFIYRRCDLILIPSPAFKESIAKRGGDGEKIVYLPNWTDEFITSDIIPDWIQGLASGFKIGFAGNIGKAQDMTSLIKAATLLKDHKDIKWFVVGDGSEKPLLEQEVINRGLSDAVFIIGQKPYDEMLPFFKACDALLVSLIDMPVFSLTIPSKIQAYMAAGQPIIASLNGEGARVINISESGLSSGAENPNELAQAILKIKSFSNEKRRLMGQNAYTYYLNNFEKHLVIDKLEMLLKNLVGDRL